ncbi:MAG: Hint domain-containing protein [Balneolaceae bacterium]
MSKIDTLFPIAFSNSMMNDLWQCELLWFRKYCQKFRSTAVEPDLIAGGLFAKGCEIVRKAYHNDKKDPEEAIELGSNYILEAVSTQHSEKTNERVAFALRRYFRSFPLDSSLTPVELADGTFAIEYCLTGDHEVLTKQGWVRLDELSKGEAILTWDKGTVVWDIPYSYIEKEYTGNLVKIEGKFNVSCLGVPEHRVPVYNKYTNKFKTYTLGTLTNNDNEYILSSGILADNVGMELPVDVARFIVALQADGSFVRNNKGVFTGAVCFGFKKERKIARLIELLDNLQYSYTKTLQAAGVTYFYIHKNDTTSKLLELMTKDKLLGSWLLDFGVKTLNIVLEELQYWDGHAYSYGTVYVSKQKVNVDILQAIAAMCGKATTIHQQGAYRLVITNNPRHKLRTLMQYKEEVPFSGKVYCPNVKSSYFMIRHNNKVSITGNCFEFDLGIPHPELPDTNLTYKGKLDGLYEYRSNGVRDEIVVLDEKTTNKLKRINGTKLIDRTKEELLYKTNGQFIGYHWAARQLGVKTEKSLIRKVPIAATYEAPVELIIPVTPFQIEIWSTTMVNKIEELKDKYLYYKQNGGLPHVAFYPILGNGCNNYARPCYVNDGCFDKYGEQLIAGKYQQVVWDSAKQLEVPLSQFKLERGLV